MSLLTDPQFVHKKMLQFKHTSSKLKVVLMIADTFNEEYGRTAETYNLAMKQCLSSGKPYEDPQFPASKESLSKTWTSLAAKQQTRWKQFAWQRAPTIFKKAPMVFQDNVEPNDIKQGLLGDCYFLSALSVLSEQSELVMRLFHTRECTPQGIFCVWLNAHGEWQSIVIDDQFPCSDLNSPAFSRAHGEELWVMIMEKAYAKMYGTYERIEGGNPAMALRDLTGAPYENMDEGTAEELWDFVWQNHQKQFLLTCYTKVTSTQEEENQLGILSGHAYAILNVAQVKDRRGVNAKLVQVRNPWGKVEWKGAWSDQSPEWTAELKQRLNVEDQDDGIFWITIEDFRKYYEGVGVCKVHPLYLYNSFKVNFKGVARQVIHMEVSGKCHGYISVNQIDERCFYDSFKGYAYAYVRILVAQITGKSTVEYVGGEYRQDRNVTCEVTLSEGDYLVLVDIEWTTKQGDTRQVVVSSYSSAHINLKSCDGIDPLTLEKTIYKDYSLKNQVKLISYKEQHKLDIEKRIGTAQGALFFYYRNLTADTSLVEKITFSDIKGYIIYPPFAVEKQQVLDFTLVPKSEIVILFSQTLTEEGICSYSYKTSSTLPKWNSKAAFDSSAYLTQMDFSVVQLVARTGALVKTIQVQKIEQKIQSKDPTPRQPQVQNIMVESHIIVAPSVSPLGSPSRARMHQPSLLGEKIFAQRNAQRSQVQVYEIEQQVVAILDEVSPGTSWSIIFYLIFSLFMLAACWISFEKPKFCSLTVIAVLVGSLLANSLNKVILRTLMCLQIMAALQSLMNLLFSNSWTSNEVAGIPDLNIVQTLFIKTIVLIEVLELCFEILSFLLMVRMIVKYETYKDDLRNIADQRILMIEEHIDSHT